jgi:hypothetical protein
VEVAAERARGDELQKLVETERGRAEREISAATEQLRLALTEARQRAAELQSTLERERKATEQREIVTQHEVQCCAPWCVCCRRLAHPLVQAETAVLKSRDEAGEQARQLLLEYKVAAAQAAESARARVVDLQATLDRERIQWAERELVLQRDVRVTGSGRGHEGAY